jgi:hypothetical protein
VAECRPLLRLKSPVAAVLILVLASHGNLVHRGSKQGMYKLKEYSWENLLSLQMAQFLHDRDNRSNSFAAFLMNHYVLCLYDFTMIAISIVCNNACHLNAITNGMACMKKVCLLFERRHTKCI